MMSSMMAHYELMKEKGMDQQNVSYSDRYLEADAAIKKMDLDNRRKIIKTTSTIMITVFMLFLLVSPLISGAQRKYEDAVLYHGRIAVQLSIPEITHFFGIYEFIGPGAFTFGFGYARPILSKEKTGSGWLNEVCAPSKYFSEHGACKAF